MKEIKFRGKGINGEWYCGLLSISQGKPGQPAKGYYISNSVGMPWAYRVRPETVGRFIGSKDKNGKEIYENNIVKIDYHSDLLEIKWHDEKMKWIATDGTFTINLNKNECENYTKVVGNKSENPKLLKEE